MNSDTQVLNFNHLIAEKSSQYLGLKEWPGAKSNPAVERFFSAAGHPGLTDDIPWCAAYVGAVLVECGVAPSGSLMARSYTKWGRDVPYAAARLGDVVVLSRGAPPSGHVAFFVRYENDKVILRGGNQGDAVTEAAFPASRIVAIRRADPSTPSGLPPVHPGDKGAIVLNMQSRLRELRYFSGVLDGHNGPLTNAALLAFQADNGLEVDGICGNRTWAALATAQPRAKRDVTLQDLRKSGSETIKVADRAEATVAATGVAGVLSVVSQASEQASAATGTLGQAQGALSGLQAMVVANWQALALCAAALALWYMVRQIKARRLRDAQTGANVAR